MAERRKKPEHKSKEQQRQAQKEKQQQGKKLGEIPSNQTPDTPEKKENEEE